MERALKSDEIGVSFSHFLFIIIAIISLMTHDVYAQSYNHENSTLANYLQRHYESQPFEGLREVEDYDNKYLACVVTTDAERKKEHNIERVVFLKASRLISEYENGVRIIEAKPISISDTIAFASSPITIVTSSSITGSLRLLISFCHNGKLVYIFLKKKKSKN